ncbi:MAG TPA: DUF429 domain-containing protein, partial [Steroidobacter sp.]|nr:DUF429 domain-containing protein [Steroidobacter sp.]
NSVREVHPEVSFAEMNGGRPMIHAKRSSSGRREREELIGTLWPGLDLNLDAGLPRGEFARDDFLDAVAALWSIRRYVHGLAACLPKRTVYDGYGLPMQIVA